MAAQVFAGISLPFAGSVLGSLIVFFLNSSLSRKTQQVLTGFTSGVMIAASVWSLLIPSMEMTAENAIPWLPTAAGFLAGVFFLLFLDKAIPHFHASALRSEGPSSNLKKATMLFLAVTIHNIPEGMAIGAVFAVMASEYASLTIIGAFVLSAGIAIQNFPEGAVVAAPLKEFGLSKARAFLFGVLSGAVEPIAAVLTFILAPVFLPAIPGLLAFAAGAMIYVVIEELIPDTHQGSHSDAGVVSTALGFTLMMVLDVAFK